MFKVAIPGPADMDLLGLPIHRVAVADLHAFIGQVVGRGEKAIAFNLNVQGVNLAVENPWLHEFIRGAHRVFCDSDGVRLGLRLLGHAPPPKITYNVWLWQLAAFCEEAELGLFFLGGKPGVAEEAASRLRVRYPRLRVVGTQDGYFEKQGAENDRVVAKINAAAPDVLLVCMGMPVQERWLQENWERVDSHVFLQGGAALDYASGRLKKAPVFMVRLHLEWLYRFFQEPQRLFSRYIIGNPQFVLRVLWSRMRRGAARLAVALAALAVLAGCGAARACAALFDRAPYASGGWTEHPGNPVIRMGDVVPHMLWNDPSVLKEGDTYRMWLTGGDPRHRERIVVELHTAQSKDGLAWEITPEPCLSPSPDPAAWDSLRIETPSVVKVQGTYHLYYSGTDERGAKEGVFAIGHATSPDGVRWTKDPANPIVTRQTHDRFQWGYTGVGEPGVVYDARTQTFYLYYVSLAFSRADPTIGRVGILLATSADGSRFTHHVDPSGERALILTRDIPNATSGAWFGYSTPTVLLRADGEFHLFCDFLVAPGGPPTTAQVALAHAVSRDGRHFTVTEEGFLNTGHRDWKDQEVRAPAVLEDGGVFKMWFAGETKRPFFRSGIGYAYRTPAPARQ
jgi:N-acetylglucosaminyldiphosphoundecaprenol N-acetyl-beta-D-mannosaminyltransferase